MGDEKKYKDKEEKELRKKAEKHNREELISQTKGLL